MVVVVYPENQFGSGEFLGAPHGRAAPSRDPATALGRAGILPKHHNLAVPWPFFASK